MTRTPARGWAVALLSRLQVSSIMLTSFTLGVFLPFIRQDLQLSPLQAGLLQGVSWITAALMSLPSGVWFSRFRDQVAYDEHVAALARSQEWHDQLWKPLMRRLKAAPEVLKLSPTARSLVQS